MSSSQPPRRRRLVGVSTKMYFTHAQTKSYISSLKFSLSNLSPSILTALNAAAIDIFVIPDFISIIPVVEQLAQPTPGNQSEGKEIPQIQVGAQDAYSEDKGAFTGEVSPAVLSEVGCKIVEINHAERRRLFGETDESTAAKVAAAARNGLLPLVCIGEPVKPPALTESKVGEEENLDVQTALPQIISQITPILAALPPETPIALAYEPVWAIGAPAPASTSYVVNIVRAIRALDCVRARPENSVRILYGGSAGPDLFAKLVDGGNGVDGLFLGRFAHDPEAFVKAICDVAEI
ncbi:mitochondrial triosephosphate isomerase [Xylariaceae sp. FL0255]|nr:mitochondrial triosephosphate isomerase [Xylariaceae sp. FL0255]